MPEPRVPRFLSSPLLKRAYLFAAHHHANQVRKGTAAPFITHPVAVAKLLRRHGFSERVMAAGLLHDVLEDAPVTPKQMEQVFGKQITTWVKAVTEPDKRHPWEYRKQRYLKQLQKAPRSALAVAAADKVHNARSLLEAYKVEGPNVFTRFKRHIHLKFQFDQQAYDTIAQAWPGCPLLPELKRCLNKIGRLVREVDQAVVAEEEIKFLLSDPETAEALARLKQLDVFRLVTKERQQQKNHYFDTPSLNLRKQRVALRIREVTGRYELTFKTGGKVQQGIATRQELNVPVETKSIAKLERQKPLPAPLKQVAPFCSGESLEHIFTMHTDRRRRVFIHKHQRVELDIDRLAFRHKGKVVYTHLEAELENLDASPEHFKQAVAYLRKAFKGKLKVSSTPKIVIGYKLWKKVQK